MADIEVGSNGPYEVHGLPVSRARIMRGAAGDALAWDVTGRVDTDGEATADGTYWLCRCGQSANKPFCDGSHRRVGFDGTETASTQPYREQARVLKTSGEEVVRDVVALCEHAEFCMRAGTDIWHMRLSTDPAVLAEMNGMVAQCPSGRLTHAPDAEAPDVEPDLPVEVLVVDDGPYLVTGRASVTRSDGVEVEARNRMTFCRCGASRNKPFCDGSHATVGFSDHGAAPTDA